MHRLGQRTTREALDYHLRRNDTPNFTVGQAGRVELAHYLIGRILAKALTERPLKIVELGCGSGDVTGPYAPPWRNYTSLSGETTDLVETGIEVVGIDVVPQSAISVPERFPNVTVLISPVEELEPIECDLLVMTEFLEHVIDPIGIVKNWGAKAKWMVIGHPLDEPDPPYEPGHNWSYTRADFYDWFRIAGHGVIEEFRFPMGPWDAMIMGHGCRLDQPALRAILPNQ